MVGMRKNRIGNVITIIILLSSIEARIQRANEDSNPLTCPPADSLDPSANFVLLYRLSHLVVVGSVSRIHKLDSNPREFRATVEINCLVKGRTFRRQIEVNKCGSPSDYCPEGHVDTAESKENFIFFLRSTNQPEEFNVLPRGALFFDYVMEMILADLCDVTLVKHSSSEAADLLCPSGVPDSTCTKNTTDLLQAIPKTYRVSAAKPITDKRIVSQKLQSLQVGSRASNLMIDFTILFSAVFIGSYYIHSP